MKIQTSFMSASDTGLTAFGVVDGAAAQPAGPAAHPSARPASGRGSPGSGNPWSGTGSLIPRSGLPKRVLSGQLILHHLAARIVKPVRLGVLSVILPTRLRLRNRLRIRGAGLSSLPAGAGDFFEQPNTRTTNRAAVAIRIEHRRALTVAVDRTGGIRKSGPPRPPWIAWPDPPIRAMPACVVRVDFVRPQPAGSAKYRSG